MQVADIEVVDNKLEQVDNKVDKAPSLTSHKPKSYLDIGFWYWVFVIVNSANISSNIERAMLFR